MAPNRAPFFVFLQAEPLRVSYTRDELEAWKQSRKLSDCGSHTEKGGEGAGVFELVEAHRGDTFRAVYTVRLEKAIYVLHCFQKKSPSGVRTARQDVDLIHERLRAAQADYEVRYGKKEG